MKSIFTREQIDYLKENYDKKSYKEIGDYLGFTERQIRGKINGMGLSKKRKFNDKYFENIDCSNKAYWLGFIYADGYVVKNKSLSNHELGIELNIDDIKVLDDFNKELGNVHTIYKKHKHKNFNGYEYDTDSCIIRIYSKKIVDDLINLNILPNKTYENIYPVCDEYFFDFIRGFLDGDGCIYISKNILFVKFTNANKLFLEYLQNKLKLLLNINSAIYKERDKKYNLCINKKDDCKKFLDSIYKYDDCQKMMRKYNLYKKFYGSPS